MEIRFSPYNSPFIPPCGDPNVYWIGREFRDMPHNAHVYRWVQWQGEEHVRQLHLEMNSAVAVLPLLDEMARDGVAAAGRRAASIRKFLSPSKSTIDPASYKKLKAKKIVKAQV